jgi:hypothetical protein
MDEQRTVGDGQRFIKTQLCLFCGHVVDVS